MDEMSVGDDRTRAVELGGLIRSYRGGDVAVLDLRKLNVWADFFVIATVSSGAHMQGLCRQVKEFSRERGLEIVQRRRRPAPDDEWTLIDLGTIVVHLMTAKSRAFYELERLWNAADVIVPEDPPAS
jgi:ribosome-associated protein